MIERNKYYKEINLMKNLKSTYTQSQCFMTAIAPTGNDVPRRSVRAFAVSLRI
ncbi:MAG: hypothetical protein ABII18_14070 [bacterium]